MRCRAPLAPLLAILALISAGAASGQGARGASSPRSTGALPTPAALREQLGRSWEELEAGFRKWVTQLAAGP